MILEMELNILSFSFWKLTFFEWRGIMVYDSD